MNDCPCFYGCQYPQCSCGEQNMANNTLTGHSTGSMAPADVAPELPDPFDEVLGG